MATTFATGTTETKVEARYHGFVQPALDFFGKPVTVASLCDRQTTDPNSELSQFIREGLIDSEADYHGFCPNADYIIANAFDWRKANWYNSRIESTKAYTPSGDQAVFLDYCGYEPMWDFHTSGGMGAGHALNSGLYKALRLLETYPVRSFVAVNIMVKGRAFKSKFWHGQTGEDFWREDLAAILEELHSTERLLTDTPPYKYVSGSSTFLTFWLGVNTTIKENNSNMKITGTKLPKPNPAPKRDIQRVAVQSLLRAGFSTEEIAQYLDISTRSVGSYKAHVTMGHTV